MSHGPLKLQTHDVHLIYKFLGTQNICPYDGSLKHAIVRVRAWPSLAMASTGDTAMEPQGIHLQEQASSASTTPHGQQTLRQEHDLQHENLAKTGLKMSRELDRWMSTLKRQNSEGLNGPCTGSSQAWEKARQLGELFSQVKADAEQEAVAM